MAGEQLSGARQVAGPLAHVGDRGLTSGIRAASRGQFDVLPQTTGVSMAGLDSQANPKEAGN